VADDKRDGADDLFEDLDKFFAPIQDVEWPEPEAPDEPAPAPSHEEHVAVHAETPAPAPQPPVNRPDPPAIPDEPVLVGAAGDDDGDDDAAWYDTNVMETLGDDAGDDVVAAPAVEGQASLLGGDDDIDEDWPGEDEEPTVVRIDADDPSPDAPSPADLEAAAAHFAESVRAEDEPDVPAGPEPTPMPFDDEPLEQGTAGDGDDFFGDLGGAGSEGTDTDTAHDDILADLEAPAGAPRTVKVGSEGLGGPSWQEPTSMEVGADIERRGPNAGERDMPAALMTAFVLAVLALVGLALGEAVFAVLATIVVLVAQFELFTSMQKRHYQPATFVGLVTGVLVMWAAYARGEGAMLAMVALGTVATFLWFLATPVAHRKNLTVQIGITLFGIAYIPLLGGYLLLTLNLPDGTALVISVIALTMLFDSTAFLGGSVFGGVSIQRPLAPATSPKKSWEGTIIATLATIIAAVVIIGSYADPLMDHRVDTAILGILIAVAATFGDLAESLVKRDLGIKDMSTILPGHGGVLDRIDSLLFVAPATFLLFRVIFL
jgi:phosphatidate cytidylyltransferase